MASQKLTHYFSAHKIVVYTKFLLKNILRKAEISERIAKWSVELGKYDIEYRPRTIIKGHVLADFIAEFTDSLEGTELAEPPTSWELHCDGSATREGAGTGIMLISQDGIVFERAFQLGFPATNNETEYEALLADMKIARALGCTKLRANSDSQLVVNQVHGEYVARDDRMATYLNLVKEAASQFKEFTLIQIPRTENSHADALATLASAIKERSRRKIS